MFDLIIDIGMISFSWGIVDVDDCCNGAQHLANERQVNPDQLCIDGVSAGGYTTLACLAFKNIFKAGLSINIV